MRINLFILTLFIIFQASAQKGKISGTITDQKGNPIPYATVHIKEIDRVIYTNNQGFYNTPKIDFNSYTIQYHSIGFKKQSYTVVLNTPIVVLKPKKLQELNYKLDEFEVIEEEEFNIRKLRAIEGVMITQGKKTEAIKVDKTDGNKATNQSRQIYAKIPGLNIWESDGAGIQLGLGGRGLHPSRNSNFNTRQNGYDISADALGYPESYYSPPTEAIDEIQIIRGAASLQFGPQFGGLINFKLKEANPNKKVEAVIRNSVGSFGLNNTFISIGGTNKKWSYYTYGNYKFGDDWRPNSSFDVKNGHLNITRRISDKSSAKIEITKMTYLAQQPGGLTDDQFHENPDTSYRSRNWFSVDWNLAAVNFDHEFSSNTKFNTRTFGLLASRKAVGNLDKPFYPDFMQERNIISGEFRNIGNESRLIHLYEIKNKPSAVLIGARIYQGYNNNIQGDGSTENTPDFNFIDDVSNMDSSLSIESNYRFPSLNLSLFMENIFNINNKLSVTPGIRFEYISTSSDGEYRRQELDNAENVIFDTVLQKDQNQSRQFLIGGIGINYKLTETIELYSNFSQNYKSINFSDMQITNPNFKIDPILKDEKGYNFDIGIRGNKKNILFFDASLYYLFYNNRIGTVWVTQANSSLFNSVTSTAPYFQLRTNVSESRTMGFEMILECDWWKVLIDNNSKTKLSNFINLAYNDAKYINSDEPAFQNKKVELVPPFILKSGLSYGNEHFSLTYQFSFTDEHFSDATNSSTDPHSIVGLIPSYFIMDLSGKFLYKKIQLEFGVNNLTNETYFTRRATAYPGPGIIPSSPRNVYLGIQITL